MATPGFAPGRADIVARLAVPAAVAASENVEHEARLKQHMQRREQRRDQGLGQHAAERAHAPAEAARQRAVGADREPAEQLGREQKGHGRAEHARRELRIDDVPHRIGRAIGKEIHRQLEARFERRADADQDEAEPQRRGEISHDASQQMQAAEWMETARADHAQVLQIALTPAPIAHRVIDQRGRRFFEAALVVGQQIHPPTGAPHERGLDEIVAQNETSEGRPAGQRGQTGMGGECAHANDGVMAPVVAVAEIPPGQPRRQHRPIAGAGKLMAAREQGVAIDQPRNGLNDAGMGIGLHQARETHDRRTTHHAVGIEHQQVLVMPAPTPAELGEIAGLARSVLVAAPIEEATVGAEPAAAQIPGLLFGNPGIGIGAVAQDEEIKGVDFAACFDLAIDTFQGAEHALRGFVVDGHDDGGAGGELGRRRQQTGGERARTAPHGKEPREPGPERQGYPNEIGGEQHHQHDFDHRDTAGRKHAAEFEAAEPGSAQGQGREQQTSPPARVSRRRRYCVSLARRPFVQRLRRHGERRGRRQRQRQGLCESDLKGARGRRGKQLIRPLPAELEGQQRDAWRSGVGMYGNAGALHQRRQPVADAVVDEFQCLGRAGVGRQLSNQDLGLGCRCLGAIGEPREVARHHALDMRGSGCCI